MRKSGKQREAALAATVHVMPPLSHLEEIPDISTFRISSTVYYPCRSIVGGQRSYKVSVTQTEVIKGD
jgi:hypothetical protein